MPPPTLPAVPELRGFVLAEWKAHFGDELTELKATPSSGVRATCMVIAADPSLHPQALADEASVEGALPPGSVGMRALALKESDPSLRQVTLVKAGLRLQRRQAESDVERERYEDMLSMMADVETPSPAELRRRVGPAVKARFGQPLKNLGGGEWAVEVPVGRTTASLCFDFGRVGRGMRYEVRMPPRPGVASPVWLSYESLIGIRFGDWDMLRSDRVDAQVDLLLPRIARVLDALATVDWSQPPAR